MKKSPSMNSNSIAEKGKKIFQRTEAQFKASFFWLFQFFIKLISSLVIGLFFSLIGDELIGYGSFSFFFILISITSAFLHICWYWTLAGILTFDVIFLLVALLMRMYFIIAPEI